MKTALYYLLITTFAAGIVIGVCLYSTWCAKRELNRYDAYERLAEP